MLNYPTMRDIAEIRAATDAHGRDADMRAELARLRAERDALADALRHAVDWMHAFKPSEFPAKAQARATLATLDREGAAE
jgi:hypothetical protein